jgi:hypothetical protein
MMMDDAGGSAQADATGSAPGLAAAKKAGNPPVG